MKPARPLISEKSMALAQKGWYSFVVPPKSRKEAIAKEISKLYNVSVVAVRTISHRGKVHRVGRKMMLRRRPDWKKAMVQLAKGQKIAIFDVGGEGTAAK
jgi:large subunit ribosomal protein L23